MSNNLLSQISSKENKIVKLDQNIIYDIIIIGAGPAGLTAAVYCMRKGIKTGLITLNIGGQLIETAGIENYMGFRYIEGYQLVEKFKEQVKQFEIGFKEGVKVSSISNDKVKKIYLEDGSIYQTKAIIIASGKSPRKLNVPGENNFMGRGVAFCATCDAPLYKGKNVAVVGGGNSGLEAVLDLAKIVKHVTIIQNLDKFTADEMLINNLKNYNNIDILYNSEVKEIIGDKNVTSIIVKNKKKSKFI